MIGRLCAFIVLAFIFRHDSSLMFFVCAAPFKRQVQDLTGLLIADGRKAIYIHIYISFTLLTGFIVLLLGLLP